MALSQAWFPYSSADAADNATLCCGDMKRLQALQGGGEGGGVAIWKPGFRNHAACGSHTVKFPGKPTEDTVS